MPTILVADDNSNIQKMVSLAFQEKGIRVVAVGNGEAACRKVPEVRPDVVLADVFMPVRNGYEVCEFVKQDPEFAQTPVILLVGAFDPLDEKEAARVGASGVLKKPFVPPEPLINLVSSLLGKTDSQQEKASEPKSMAETARADSKIEYASEAPFVEPARKPSAPGASEFRLPSAEANSGLEVTPAPGQPAKPAPSDASNDDDLGPENAWMQRRASTDYEIDAADSADLVERLAGARTDSAAANESEDEILPSDKHVPFAGANIPEVPADEPRRRWSDVFARESSAKANPPEAVPIEETASEPDTDRPSVSSYGVAPPELEVAEREADTKDHVSESAFAQEPSSTPEAPAQSSNVLPFTIHEPKAEPPSANRDNAADPFVYSGTLVGDSEASPSHSESPEIETEKSADLGSATEEISYALSSDSDADLGESHVAATHAEPMRKTPEDASSYSPAADIELQTDPETAPTEEGKSESLLTAPSTSTPEKADDASVDDVVAKVISKLEPQLHQALANGVLRPLVEQLLNEKRGKK